MPAQSMMKHLWPNFNFCKLIFAFLGYRITAHFDTFAKVVVWLLAQFRAIWMYFGKVFPSKIERLQD